MTPDENREWYIYHNEKEMGPVLESQLKIRLQGGELDSSAFVFTEGMSDWTAIEEVKVFANPGDVPEERESSVEPDEELLNQGGVSEAKVYPEQPDESSIVDLHSHKGLSVETLGAGDPLQAPQEFLKEDSQNTQNSTEAGRGKWLRWSFLGFVLLVAVGVFVDYMMVTSPGRPEFIKYILGEASEFSDKSTDIPGKAVEATLVPSQNNKEDLIWAELFAARNSKDPKGAPFRLSSQMFSPERPILSGALAAPIQADVVHMVVYPDLAQNLMSDPKVWWLSVPVVDGYFVAGPLSLKGVALPVGIYRAMLQANGKFLGEVSFQVGEFPTGPELAVAQKDLQNTYLMAASKELQRLEETFRSFETLYETLRQNSAKFALKGKAGRAAWDKSKAEWNEAFDRTAVKFNEEAALTYYPDVQAKMAEYSRELLRVVGLMDLYNQKGRLAFEKRAGARYSDVWNALKKDKDFLKAEITNLEGQKALFPTLDRDLLKADLLNLR